jgi:hypothetical protein
MVDDCIGGVGIWKNLMSERTRVVTHMLGVSAFGNTGGNHAHITFTNHYLPDSDEVVTVGTSFVYFYSFIIILI